MTKRWLILLLVLVLLSGTVLFGLGYYQANHELVSLRQRVSNRDLNIKTLSFTLFFIDKVLKAQGEVDFETRLQLENKVREINNPDILVNWQRFTDVQTEAEAQAEVKDFLELLVKNIKPEYDVVEP